jgi:hypothetical protein
MNRKITVALFALPVGAIALLIKPASAAEVTFSSEVSQTPVLVAQQYNGRRDYDQRDYDQRDYDQRDYDQREAARREAVRRDEARREAIQREAARRQVSKRVWIPGHWESGFLGIGRKWVEGHWEER